MIYTRSHVTRLLLQPSSYSFGAGCCSDRRVPDLHHYSGELHFSSTELTLDFTKPNAFALNTKASELD
nr:hypothetical protein CFP56_42833 [Quercus suber]